MINLNTNFDWAFYFILYILLVFAEITIFVIYMSRTLKVAFLIVIAPLVCATYSLDKLRDGKAQAFENWIKEFVIAVFQQPMQLLIYTIFINSAGEILVNNMFFGVLFMLLIPYGGRIFKSVLKFEGNKSLPGGKGFEGARKGVRTVSHKFVNKGK